MAVEIVQENITIEFNEDQAYVEFRYDGLNQAALLALTGRVDDLETDLAAAGATAAGATATVAANLASLDALVDGAIADLATETAARIAADSTTNAALLAGDAALQAAIDAEEAARIAADAAEVIARDAAIAAALGGVTPDITALEATVASHTASITSLIADMATLASDQDTVEAAFTALSADFTALESDVADNTAAVVAEASARAAADVVLQDQIDLLAAPPAADVTYDNTSSGLTATNVQAAIDELDTALDALSAPDAADVAYSNVSSGMTATNVQAAIDEIDTVLDGLGTAATADTGDFAAAAHTHELTDLDATGATDGHVATADGLGGIVWEAPTGGSGDVATDTIWDAKGDLAVGTGADTAARLPVGTDGYVLTADSAEATGLKWAAGGSGSSPTTTEGDLIRRGASADERLPVGTEGQVLSVVSGVPAWADAAAGGGGGGVGALAFVGEFAVSGSAATDLSVTGLDLDTDETYFIEIEGHNAAGSASTLSLYFNSDTTTTNYDRQSLYGSGSTAGAARTNGANFVSPSAGNTFSYFGWLRKDFDTRPYFLLTGRVNDTSAVQALNHFIGWRTTATNVTGFTLSGSVASSLDVGTRIRVWKLTTSGAAAGGGDLQTIRSLFENFEVVSDTSFNVSPLAIDVPAAGTYLVRFQVAIENHSTPDCEWNVDFDGTFSSALGFIGRIREASAYSITDITTLPAGSGVMTTTDTTWYSGQFVLIATSAGTVFVQIRQNTSSATAVAIRAGSWLTVTPHEADIGGTSANEVYVAQAANLTITSNNVFQDTDLVAALSAGTWEVELHIWTYCHATPDMEWRLTFGGTLSSQVLSNVLGRDSDNATFTFPSVAALPFVQNTAATATFSHRVTARLVVTAAGDLKVQARQVTSSATSIIFYGGSWMRCKKVA